MKKKAFDRSTVPTGLKENLKQQPQAIFVDRVGIQGDALIEAVPNYNRRISEKVIEGANNASIVLGRDRPGEIGSGYGNETGAGNIDLVVGRVSRDIQEGIINDKSLNYEPTVVDTNLSADASRIYISQKTDVDANFATCAGSVGESKAMAAIAIKSDSVRVISRGGGMQLLTTRERNSHGGATRSVPRIDIIAGNIDKTLEPAVKGKALRKALKNIITRIDELNSVLDSFMTYQMELNTAIQGHQHPGPMLMLLGALSSGNPLSINGGQIPFSPELLQAGIKATGFQQISKMDGVMNKLKIATTNKNISEVYGATEASSTGVRIN